MKNISFCKGSTAFWYLIIFGFSLSYTPVQANKLLRQPQSSQQQHQISGTITDGTNPLPGVTVSIKGKATSGIISDFNGQYTLSTSPTDILVFNFMGFKTATEYVDGRKTINIQLQEDITSLQEVRVNAGYYSVKEKERTGSIAKISAKDIEKQPVANVLAAMQGRMTGVNISQATGTPGGNFNIQIRGLNSLRGLANEPLYIVNGVPYASQSLGSSDAINGVLPALSSPLNSINPADIQSIEVLKDADATAIYGSRGANGVVLITTKTGKAGTTKFTLQASSTFGSVVGKLKMLTTDQYLSMRRDAFANDGIATYPADAYDINGTWDQTRDTDWQEKLIGNTSYIQNLQASVSGGSEQTQFIISATSRSETTVTADNGAFKKAAIHTGINHTSANNKFKINLSADYSSDENTLPGRDMSRYAYTLAPNAPALYTEEGKLNWENGTFANPLGYLDGEYRSLTKSLISNMVLSYNFFKDIVAKINLGYNDSKLSEYKTFPSTMFNPLYNLTSADSQIFNNAGSRNSWIIEPQLQWQGSLGKTEITTLIGATFQSQKQELSVVYGFGFPSNALIHNMTAASTVLLLTDEITQYKYNAFFGRLNANYDGKYIVNITGRRDGSSRFGPNNRYANFGAVGLAWLFHKESLFKNVERILSFGKLRSSYGITGNDQIGDYQYLNTYMPSSNVYDGIIGLQPSRLLNPNFGWETNKKFETALDLGFLQDRILINTSYFQNRSSNQLVGLPLPGTTGFSSVQANIDATVENKGFEFELHTANFQGTNFKWSTTVNLTIPKNKLIKFNGLEGSTYANTFVIGESINIQKLYHYTGIDPATGTYKFEDFTGDGKITIADRQIVSDSSPKFYGGIANSMTYKNWNLELNFQFVKQEATNELLYFSTPGIFSNQPEAVLNHFPTSNDANSVQQYTSGRNGAAISSQSNYTQSDAIIKDASYIRLKNIALTYALPTNLSKGFNASIYLQAQNLLTFTKYSGVDPETRSLIYLPTLKQFTIGVQISF